jgi:hypothetical protein
MEFLYLVLICESFLAFLDPDPQTQLNPDPVRILKLNTFANSFLEEFSAIPRTAATSFSPVSLAPVKKKPK